MTEEEWLECEYPTPMLTLLEGKVSDRKLRLFACAGCRSVWSLLANNECRRAVELAELVADDPQLESQLAADCQAIWDLSATHQGVVADPNSREGAAHNAAKYTTTGKMFHVKWAAHAVRVLAARSGTSLWQVGLLHDIFGNPFRPVTINPSWLTSTVLALTTGIYEEKAFDRMPILADALQDAGCDNEAILQHCRGPGPHVRGCFLIDLVLGKG
jgi:hypothetical protein